MDPPSFSRVVDVTVLLNPVPNERQFVNLRASQAKLRHTTLI